MRRGITAVSATQFLTVFDGIVVVIALPSISRQFGIGTVDAQWVITSYTLPFAGLLLVAGRLGDFVGRRWLLQVGLVTFGLGLFAAGLARSLAVLLLARVVQGIGAAAAAPAAFALISSAFPAGRRGAIFAIASSAGSAASVAGAALGGLVVDRLDWHWIFLLSAPVALSAAVLAGTMPESRVRHTARGIDGRGAALATATLVVFVFAVTNIERGGATSAWTVSALLATAALAAGFVVTQRVAARPLLPHGLIRISTLRTGVVGVLGLDFAYNATVLLGLLALQSTWGYTASAAGICFLPFATATALAAPLAATALKRWGGVRTATAGLLLSAAGLLLLAAAPTHASYAGDILPGLLVLGPGIAFGFVALAETAGSEVPDRDKGVAYGIFETATHASGTVAVATLATVAAAASYDASFVLAAAITIAVAAVVSVMARRSKAPAVSSVGAV